MVAVGKCQHYPSYPKKGQIKYRKPLIFALFRSSHMTGSAQVWAKLKYLLRGRTLTYHILERQTNKQQHSQLYIWSLPSGSLSPQGDVLCCPSTTEPGRTERSVHTVPLPSPTGCKYPNQPGPNSTGLLLHLQAFKSSLQHHKQFPKVFP